MKLIFLVCIILVVLIAGGTLFFLELKEPQKNDTYTNNPQVINNVNIRTTNTMLERVQITTKDGTTIAGNYYPALGTKSILLLHMMPATKESWTVFADKLQKAGFSVLAIDLRGHGESDGGREGYKSFSNTEHQSSIQDVGAAVEFLKNKKSGKLYIAGASIGANLSLQFAVNHPETKKIILLSAGLNYYDIITEPLALKLHPDQSIYFVGDEDDMRKSGNSAGEMSQKLYETTSAKKEIKIFKGAGHGTDMLMAHPEFEDELIQWLLQ